MHLLFPLLSLLYTAPQPLAAAPATRPAAFADVDRARVPSENNLAVTVVVSALASESSAVKLYFYNVRETFLVPKGYAFMRVVKPGGQRQVRLPVQLPPGEWAVAITQDLNNNDKVDKNMLGIPTEPFAFSNNVRPRLAPPAFDDCKFLVREAGQVVSIQLLKK
ncbi:DUF2141 domain-containing protein [Hymenobacter actinosclerus]|uniref:Uncharacterized conserved protein, DUF2141 family n=1 Tax=Hymenobacter actinosclerus TaxID=82805 RepID=A0A1H9ZG77_9BACT|nr:DUF2141 domain-containing protein [Hymenobacter actinosclerus]SES80658.1 Uncharacterized conserved protein, DUF2141 family [Hymenobacter actinosclerus]